MSHHTLWISQSFLVAISTADFCSSLFMQSQIINFLLYLNLVIVLGIPLRLLSFDLYNFLQCGLCEQAHCTVFFFPAITLLFIWQWHIGVYEEMFDVNRKMAQTMQNIWNFIVAKLSLLKKRQTRVIIREIRSKIWSLLDYREELTALLIIIKTNLFVSLTHCEREGN